MPHVSVVRAVHIKHVSVIFAVQSEQSFNSNKTVKIIAAYDF